MFCSTRGTTVGNAAARRAFGAPLDPEPAAAAAAAASGGVMGKRFIWLRRSETINPDLQGV